MTALITDDLNFTLHHPTSISYSHYYYSKKEGPIQTGVTVPASELFNVDAYKPGDFKQFYVDPRTRAGYLQWVEMLLAAEEYHAGNLKVGNDSNE